MNQPPMSKGSDDENKEGDDTNNDYDESDENEESESNDENEKFIAQNVPWYRKKKPSVTSESSDANKNQNNYKTGLHIFKQILKSTSESSSQIQKNIQDIYIDREVTLEQVLNESRYHNIEHFLSTEFEQQTEELLTKDSNSIIKCSKELLQSPRTHGLLTSWYLNVISKYEKFLKIEKVIRSCFLRTFECFRQSTDYGVRKLHEKHARELAMTKAVFIMNVEDGMSTTNSEQHLILTQIRERQLLELAQIREINDMTSAREISMLEFHLNCNEEIMQKDLAMWKHVTNIKIAHHYQHDKTKQSILQYNIAEADLKLIKQKEELAFLQLKLEAKLHEKTYSAREQDRKRRYTEFFVQNKALANDALYKLTFSSRDDTLYLSESASDDDDDDEYENLGPSISDAEKMHRMQTSNVPNEVISLKKEQRKRFCAQALEANIRMDKTLRSMDKDNRKERKTYIHQQRSENDRISESHLQDHDKKLEKWSHELKDMHKRHKMTVNSLIEKQKVDKHILLESKRQNSVAVELQQNSDAQHALSCHAFHEMRNVLCSLLAISEDFDSSTQDELKILAQRQQSICNYAVETMDAMLNITSYQGKVYNLKLQDEDLRKVLQNVMDLQGSRVQKSVKLEIKMTSTNMTALIDKHVITQLMVNLLSNAAKFTDVGVIRLYANIVKEGVLEIGVADTGNGLNTSQKKVKDEYLIRSTGYGLQLIRLLTKTLEGTFTILSPLPHDHWIRQTEIGGPGTFCVTTFNCKCASTSDKDMCVINNENVLMPLADQVVDSQPWKFNPSGIWKCLVADDQFLVRSFILHMLAKLVTDYPNWTLEVQACGSAEAAIRRCQRTHFDLLIIDQHYDQNSITPPVSPGVWHEQTNYPEVVLSRSSDNIHNMKIFRANDGVLKKKGDGEMLGTEFVDQHEATGICILASGSPVMDINYEIFIVKPYTKESLVAAITAGLSNPLGIRQKLVFHETTVVMAHNSNHIVFTRN